MDHKSKETDVLEVLKDDWDLRKPGLLISITGAAGNVTELDDDDREKFFGDIIKAAYSTG